MFFSPVEWAFEGKVNRKTVVKYRSKAQRPLGAMALHRRRDAVEGAFEALRNSATLSGLSPDALRALADKMRRLSVAQQRDLLAPGSG